MEPSAAAYPYRRLRRAGGAVAALLTAVSFLALVLDDGPPLPTGLAAAVPGCATPAAVQPPAANLADTVAQAAAGTCFLLAPGTYSFHDVVPKDGMAFVGTATDQVVVDGTGHENAFHGTAADVVIGQMTFDGFDNSGGTSRQEQAPIRGTPGLWQGVRGAMATNWLISDVVSRNNYASGLFLGEHWTVRNSVFQNNGVTGIGGNLIVGGLIENNIIHGNGAQQASGAATNGGGIKVTQAGTSAAPVLVRNNELYGNEEIAIWCDLGCGGFQVLDNYIHDHRSQAVMFELSNNLVVRGNTILRSNTWTDFLGDFNAAAVTVGEARDALIESNRIDVAQAGVAIRQTARPYPGENLTPYINLTYVAGAVTVRNNLIGQVGSMGISTGTSGGGLIADPSSITFTGNTYQDPLTMSFWWNNGTQMTFAQWQAEGRDTTSSGTQPSVPENQTRGPGTGDGLQLGSTTTTTTSPTTAPPTTSAPSTTVQPGISSTVVPPIPARSPANLTQAGATPGEPIGSQPVGRPTDADISTGTSAAATSADDASTSTDGAGWRRRSGPDPDLTPGRGRPSGPPTGTIPIDRPRASAVVSATTPSGTGIGTVSAHPPWGGGAARPVTVLCLALAGAAIGGRAAVRSAKRRPAP